MDIAQSASWVEDFKNDAQPQSSIRNGSAQANALGQTWAHEYLHDNIPVLKEHHEKTTGDEELAALADQVFGKYGSHWIGNLRTQGTFFSRGTAGSAVLQFRVHGLYERDWFRRCHRDGWIQI